MREDPPKALTLHELLLEVKKGYVLHRPILVEIEPGSRVTPEVTIDRTLTIRHPLDWVEEYSRELGHNVFLMLGPNTILAAADQTVSIGRSRRCDLRIDNDSVSKVHAQANYDPSAGEYFVTDENSRNGTRINGEPLSAGVPTAIWSGAHVAFGDALYVFLDPPTLRKLAKLAV